MLAPALHTPFTQMSTTPLTLPRLPNTSELLAVNPFYATRYQPLKAYLDGCVANIEVSIELCKEDVEAGDSSSAKELAQLTSFHNVLVNSVLKSLDDGTTNALMYH